MLKYRTFFLLYLSLLVQGQAECRPVLIDSISLQTVWCQVALFSIGQKSAILALCSMIAWYIYIYIYIILGSKWRSKMLTYRSGCKGCLKIAENCAKKPWRRPTRTQARIKLTRRSMCPRNTVADAAAAAGDAAAAASQTAVCRTMKQALLQWVPTARTKGHTAPLVWQCLQHLPTNCYWLFLAAYQ